MKNNPRNILLVEDNDDDAFLTKRALESAGIVLPIHHYRDGGSAIDYLKRLADTGESRPPELVLLDLKMPQRSGLEVLQWIRNHDILHFLIVLARTSSREHKDVMTAYNLHINAYLVKPSSLSEMTELARSIRHFWLDQPHLVTLPLA
jgi:CheY-like chemotaxis protein